MHNMLLCSKAEEITYSVYLFPIRLGSQQRVDKGTEICNSY